MSEAPRLYQLQLIDLDLDDRRRRLEQLEAQVGETAALQSARSQLGEAERERKELAGRVRRLEQELEVKNARIAELHKRLFGGSVGKQKEATALEKELASLKHERGKIEDSLLEAMASMEEEPVKLAEAKDAFVKAEATWRDEQAAMQAEIDTLRSSIGDAETARRQAAAGLSGKALHLYEDLRKTHRGRAVARVERNTCLGCRVELPMGEVQRARTSEELSLCSFCGRILHLAKP